MSKLTQQLMFVNATGYQTEAEWEKTARGEEGNLYPWGNTFDPANATIRATGIRGTVAEGSFPAGASPYIWRSGQIAVICNRNPG